MTTTTTSAKKVMVVEDESVISLDIRNSLTKLGYAISGVAVSGEAALRKIERNRPDVVLMDIHLKGEMTGIDVSKKVKSDFQIPVVYLTANADDSTFKEAQHTDPFGFVLKPFEEKELGIAIEIALNKHQKEQTVRSSESWYATAFQSLREAVVATDPHGDVVFMNAAAESMTGWSLADALDQPVTEVLIFQRKIQQFDQIGPTQSINSILGTVLRDRVEVTFPVDARLTLKSAKYVLVKGKATVLEDASGRIVGSLFMFEQMYSDSPSASETDRALATRNRLATTKNHLLPSIQQSDDDGLAPQENVELIDRKEVELVEAFTHAFINRQILNSSTGSLIASVGENGSRLTSRTEGVVVNVKLVRDKLTAVVKEDSAYAALACHFLTENSFFPVRRRANGNCHYQYCEVPERCQVYRTEGMELWKAWHGNRMPGQLGGDRVRYPILRENIVVFRRGSWHRIQKLVLAQETLHIKTVGGEIYSAVDDPLVWGIQSY